MSALIVLPLSGDAPVRAFDKGEFVIGWRNWCPTLRCALPGEHPANFAHPSCIEGQRIIAEAKEDEDETGRYHRKIAFEACPLDKDRVVDSASLVLLIDHLSVYDFDNKRTRGK